MEKELLIEIRDLLKEILNNNNVLPQLVYAREIEENYKINLNKADELCKKYGTNIGGLCIEKTKLQEVFHNADLNFFD